MIFEMFKLEKDTAAEGAFSTCIMIVFMTSLLFDHSETKDNASCQFTKGEGENLPSGKCSTVSTETQDLPNLSLLKVNFVKP